MTEEELERFYNSDDHRYELKNNKNYKDWMKYLKKQGYIPLLSISELEELINHIAAWYEKKYPDKDFDIPYESSIFELFSSLSRKERQLLNGDYRGYGFQKLDNEEAILLTIYYNVGENKSLTPALVIKAKPNGELFNEKLSFDNYNDKPGIELSNIKDLKSLYQELSKYNDQFDLHELEEAIYNNYCDNLVRKYTLRLVPLKLLYSPMTISFYGYMRANKFIDDFSSYYSSKNINIGLDNSEISIIVDSITNKNNGKVLKK